MTEILLGTTNPSKAAYLAHQLRDYDVKILTLGDLGIEKAADEAGRTPMENAMAKAAWYGQFHPHVIAQDSALYIRELTLDDPRQPGLFIKRRPDGHEMDDDEMLVYYTDLVHRLGGRVTAWYQDGYGVSCRGKVEGFMDTGPVNDIYAFQLVDRPHPERHPGWPLDSISIRPRTGRYFVEDRENAMTAVEEVLAKDFKDRLLAFYVRMLGLERR